MNGKTHAAVLYPHRKILFKIVITVKIDGAVAELGEALHAAARAAPELIVRTGEYLEKPARHGLEIGRHARFRVLRGENGVGKGVVVIVGIPLVTRDAEESARKLKHVVDIARLAIAVGALGVEDIVRAEVLPLRIAASDIGVPLDDHAEKHLRHAQIAGRIHDLAVQYFAMQDEITLQRANDLGDCRVRVQIFQDVLALRQDCIEERFFVKDMRRFRKARLLREGVQLVHAVVHAAVFDGEHALLRRIIPRKHAFGDPIPQPFRDIERGRIAAQPVAVQKPCKQLVHRVPRHPRLRLDIQLSALDIIKLRLGILLGNQRRRPQKAGAAFAALLTLPEPVHHAYKLLLDLVPLVRRNARIAGRLRECREIVPGAVSRNQLILPAAVADIGRRDARILVKSCKKTPDV